MALEALLPSEIARLVYGYLIDEKCSETAKSFLNESPNLQECRIVLSHGRHFTTRVCGHDLRDILEKFCVANAIVQDKIDQFDNSDKLKQCVDLIGQIRFLLEEYKNQQLIDNVDVPLQNTSTVSNGSPTKSRKRRSSSSKDEERPKQVVQIFDKEVQTQIQVNHDKINNANAVEATLLKNLPGYVNYSENGKSETVKSRSPKKSRESSKTEIVLLSETVNKKVKLHEALNEDKSLPLQRCSGLNTNIVITSTEESCKQYTNSEVQTSEVERYKRLDKNIMTDTIEAKHDNCIDSEVQTSDFGSPDSGVPPADKCVELLGDFTLELLNRTEIQERIAENINRILEPIKSNISEKDGAKEESSKCFITEFNKVIEIALNKTENDPELLELLNEIMSPSAETWSTEDEVEMEIESVNKLQEKIDSISEEKICENGINKQAVLVKNDQKNAKTSEMENPNNAISTDSSKCIINPTEIKQFDSTKSTTCLTNPLVIEQVDLIKENFKVPGDTQNNLEKNTTVSLNSLESPILQQKLVATTDNFFSHNNTITSTPLKTFTAVQGFDTCDWFSTEALQTPSIVINNTASRTNTYTACETMITTTANFISPIISKDTSNIAEKVTAINCSSTNARKYQTLNTPDVVFPPKINVSNSKTPTFPTNIVPRNKTPVLQKSSEVIDDLLNLHTSEKSNGNVDNLSSLLKGNSDYNKYFSIDSIMLYGMDSNGTTIPNPLTVPEIEVNDPITLTGTGLSPFLKIKRNSDEPDAAKEKSDEEVVSNVISEKSDEPVAETKRNEEEESEKSTFVTNINPAEGIASIGRTCTPKALREQRLRLHNRLSLSTPKKHVRALHFETPRPVANRSLSESKASEINLMAGRSPESIMRDLKDSCKSSLFRSPDVTNAEIIEQRAMAEDLPPEIGAENQVLTEEGELENKSEKNPKEKPSEGDDATSKKESPLKKTDDIKPAATSKEGVKKNSWDSDLRMYLGSTESPKHQPRKYKKKKSKGEASKKATPKKSKKSDKKTPKKSKKSSKRSTPRKSKKSDKSKPSSDEKKAKVEEMKVEETKVEETKVKGTKVKEMKVEETKVKEKKVEKTKVEEMKVEETKAEPAKEPETKIQPEASKNEEVNPTKDPLVAILSDSINEGEIASENDVMKLASEEMNNLNQMSKNESLSCIVEKVNGEIVEKMHQDEEAMAAAFESISKNLTAKLLTEQELKPEEQKKDNPEASKTTVDYEHLEQQLSILTNTDPPQPLITTTTTNSTPTPTPTSITTTTTTTTTTTIRRTTVIYDQVSRIEQGRLVQKKYARLKTLDTNIAAAASSSNIISSLGGYELELETPRKDEESCSLLQVPATPRVLSPGNSCSLMLMPCSKFGEDGNSLPRSVRSLVTTPLECPLTPDIVLTPPKAAEESTRETLQKAVSSSYFQPAVATFEVSKKYEITQFEVIKENLLKDNKRNRQPESKDVENVKPKSDPEMSYRQKKDVTKSERSASSSSCTSSCTCCSSASTSGEDNGAPDAAPKNVQSPVEGPQLPPLPPLPPPPLPPLPPSITIEPPLRPPSLPPLPPPPPTIPVESSPAKVFPIHKTDQDLTDTLKETPAKDENACAEAGIFDTPNVSKPADQPTNLNAKISQMLIQREQEEMRKLQESASSGKPKLKIISVERVLPKIVAKPPTQLMRALPLNIQMKALEVKNEAASRAATPRIRIEKSEEEVAMAVKSIVTLDEDDRFNESSQRLGLNSYKSQEDFERSTSSVIALTPDDKDSDKDDPNKVELVKAVQSIINLSGNSPVQCSPFKKPDNSVEEIQPVDEKKETDAPDKLNLSSCSRHSHNTRFASRQQRRLCANSMSPCMEHTYVYDEDRHLKKKRMKHFSDEALRVQFYNENLSQKCVWLPTALDVLYNVPPPRKKRAPAGRKPRSRFVYMDESSQESREAVMANGNSSEPSATETASEGKEADKISIKRKRAAGESEQMSNNVKRKKNMFIL